MVHLAATNLMPSRYQSKDAPLRLIADRARQPVRRKMREALAGLGGYLDHSRAVDLARAGRWADLISALDWNHFREILKGPFDVLASAYEEAARYGARKINGSFGQRQRPVRFRKDVGDVYAFDRFSPATQAALRAEQDRLIADLTMEARRTINAVILAALKAGNPPESIVDDIVRVIGLTDRQALAVLNYRRMLGALDPAALTRQLSTAADDAALRAAISTGQPLADAVIDRMTANYLANYLDYRAKTIAQTESVRAASAGLHDSYAQAIERGAFPAAAVRRHWQVAMDERTCPICLSVPAMNKDGVGVGAPFMSIQGPVKDPPIHVSCRCSVEYVTNLDLLEAIA